MRKGRYFVDASVVLEGPGLVRRWQAARGDVVFSRYLNYAGSPFERLIGWTKMADGPETELITELAPYVGPSTPVVDKYIYTLFTKVRLTGWRRRGSF